jgi:GNAT superfamily N-acetyltransferase
VFKVWEVETTLREAGEQSPLLLYTDTIRAHQIELQQTSAKQYQDRLAEQVFGVDRWEMIAWLDDEIVGCAIIMLEEDIHVGPCVSVVHQFVSPCARNRGFARLVIKTAKRIAQAYRIGTIAYAHRLGPWRYVTTYRNVPYVQDCQESNERVQED